MPVRAHYKRVSLRSAGRLSQASAIALVVFAFILLSMSP